MIWASDVRSTPSTRSTTADGSTPDTSSENVASTLGEESEIVPSAGDVITTTGATVSVMKVKVAAAWLSEWSATPTSTV